MCKGSQGDRCDIETARTSGISTEKNSGASIDANAGSRHCVISGWHDPGWRHRLVHRKATRHYLDIKMEILLSIPIVYLATTLYFLSIIWSTRSEQ